jgi:hypothetical protein
LTWHLQRAIKSKAIEKMPDKKARLAEFFRRLEAAPRASSFDEAYQQICGIMNAMEDELTRIPDAPENWKWDGRLYPPQMDRVVRIKNGVTTLRSRGHDIEISISGRIQITNTGKAQIVLIKPGANEMERDS